MRTCLIPGSFDPFTVGHLDIVKRAAKLFDTVYVAIVTNSEKNGYFSFAQRKRIAEVSCEDIKNVKVITATGMTCDLCAALGVCAVVKGIRNASDFDYETMLSGVQHFLAPNIETIFLPSSAEYSFICSAFVRELIKYERPLNGVLHKNAVELLKIGFDDNKLSN